MEPSQQRNGPSDVFDPGTFLEDNSDFSTIVQKRLDEAAEHRVLQTQFNSITPEVALKPHNVAAAGPNDDDLDFTEADVMISFAQAHHLRVHGHVLLFHQSIPQWALEYEKNNTWTGQQWRDWLRYYILTVMGRDKGIIASWDVLNEICHPFGGPYRTDSMFWWRLIGEDYIEKAFQWAEEADPDAKLFWQHWVQRRTYNNVARAYRDGVAPQNQWGITLWNIADPKSFLNIVKFWFDIRFLGGSEYPLLWDADYNLKPAYYGFHNGLQGVAERWFWPIFSNKD